jgi:hypothetical protein
LDAEHLSASLRARLPAAKPEKWAAKIAVELMRQEGEWLPDFIPGELVKILKVTKPQQTNSPYIFEDHDSKKKWIYGFVTTVDGSVLRNAVIKGYGQTLARLM